MDSLVPNVSRAVYDNFERWKAINLVAGEGENRAGSNFLLQKHSEDSLTRNGN